MGINKIIVIIFRLILLSKQLSVHYFKLLTALELVSEI